MILYHFHAQLTYHGRVQGSKQIDLLVPAFDLSDKNIWAEMILISDSFKEFFFFLYSS